MNRCEGWRRYGGAFTVGGIPKWEQCKEQGTVMLTIDKKTLPACEVCWQECIDNGLKITRVTPIAKQDYTKNSTQPIQEN